MGAYASNFRGSNGGLVSDISHPSQPDWITIHTTASGLSVVEVERLWYRFQQLGATPDGVLPPEALQKPPAANDIFAKNILSNLRSDSGDIPFQTFLLAAKWAQSTSIEEKVKGVFHLINGGKPITQDVLEKVLRRIYTDDSPQAVKRITEVFMEQMDEKKQGYIEEQNFVDWVRTLPAETVESILSFQIIPPEVTKDMPKSPSKAPTRQSTRPPTQQSLNASIPTDGMLKQIADHAQRKDWQLLANKLGFTSEEVQDIEEQYRMNAAEQVYQLLYQWRDRDGQQATIGNLEKALRESNMNDVAMILQP